MVSPFGFASQGNLCCVLQVITASYKLVNQDEKSTSFVVIMTSDSVRTVSLNTLCLESCFMLHRRLSALYMSGPDTLDMFLLLFTTH